MILQRKKTTSNFKFIYLSSLLTFFDKFVFLNTKNFYHLIKEIIFIEC